MSVYRDEKRGTWTVSVYYRDYENEVHRKTKRGFRTKREALEWERNFVLLKSRCTGKLFRYFWETYTEDIKPQVRKSTWDAKEHVIRTKILPFFGEMKLDMIKPRDIIKWQNQIAQMKRKDGSDYAASYYKTIQSQLSSVFNHAVRYYDLESNPVKKVLPISGGRPQEFRYWKKEEFEIFISHVPSTSIFYYAFEMLYWCGLREGELFALTLRDFDFNKKTVEINKTFTVVKGEPIISLPKTQSGLRTVTIPESLCNEIEGFVKELQVEEDERIFKASKTQLNLMLQKYAEESGVERIRVHDLRHSHVSLLIHMGFSAVAIGKRVGHKSERITYYYAHLFPGVQEEISKRLDEERNLITVKC